MAVLKCPMCGGELEVDTRQATGVCQYCGSTVTIPKALDEKGNLYNRANFLRQNNEFDKAVEAYEAILKLDNSDAEAHFGLALSTYGIEFVEDPKTKERVPTCHRMHRDSILTSTAFKAALQFAQSEARAVYQREGERIADIQKRFLAISAQEKPFDVFICYKESDDTGSRTEDSVLAQELYHELTKRGFQVFFARKTLESKLGSEYEPIIFAALHSAKTMVVLGTKPEHFNAVWVRNEWSRYLELVRREGGRTLIPAYRGMSPYELPEELSALQCLDMSRLGFVQDLCDGIGKMVHRGGAGAVPAETSAAASGIGLARMIQNADTFLRLDDFDKAQGVFNQMVDQYPEAWQGWWGLVRIRTRDFTHPLALKDLEGENGCRVHVLRAAALAGSEVETLRKTWAEYLSSHRDATENDLNDYRQWLEERQDAWRLAFEDEKTKWAEETRKAEQEQNSATLGNAMLSRIKSCPKRLLKALPFGLILYLAFALISGTFGRLMGNILSILFPTELIVILLLSANYSLHRGRGRAVATSLILSFLSPLLLFMMRRMMPFPQIMIFYHPLFVIVYFAIPVLISLLLMSKRSLKQNINYRQATLQRYRDGIPQWTAWRERELGEFERRIAYCENVQDILASWDPLGKEWSLSDIATEIFALQEGEGYTGRYDQRSGDIDINIGVHISGERDQEYGDYIYFIVENGKLMIREKMQSLAPAVSDKK